MGVTRRGLVGAGPALGVAACATTPGDGRSFDAIVVGAGVFGAWTAEYLRRANKRVLLVDRLGPGNASSSSGGESRMTRGTYGANGVYAQMAMASLVEWRTLSERASLPLFHRAGVLFMFGDMVDYARDSIATHRELGLPLEQIDRAELAARWPQMNYDGIEFGLFEAEFGPLMARRGVQETVRRFVAQGGAYRLGHAAPDANDGHVVHVNGEALRGDAIVYSCGPWLPKLFPDILGGRISVERQEVAFVAPPEGDVRFEASHLPGWADYNNGDLYYGFPNLEARGFKISHDAIGPEFDPDVGDRTMSEGGMALLRTFMERRFPALRGQPFVEFRICQSEKSSNGDFLIDRHPTREGAFLLGAGSAHGFKHGPEVGRLAADLALGRSDVEPRYSLATKDVAHSRAVL